ncbi:MAG TPA: T9SS type A sorting domain-containing protein [Ignavibacteriaceae bacterium]|nr:T9SS type A sorting domain-containing protein [Ignavibacteriaceae bacterium]
MKKHISLVLLILFLSASSLFAQEGFHLLTTMSGDSIGDQFSVVSHIGDINADGFDDVIVGAPGGDYAKLFFGGAVFDTIPDLIFKDYKQLNCYFGCAITGDGDINGDGYPDIIIGASDTWIGPSFPFEIMTTGAAYVYFGGPMIDTTADLTLIVGDWLTQTGWYYEFGSSVAIPGDLNGDGYDDFVIGAANDDYDAHGRVYIYYGGPNVDDQYDVLLEGEDVFDNFGFSLSAVGDMKNDGFDDVLIGAPMFHNNIPNKIYQGGKAYLVYGGNEINLTNSIEFTGDTSSYQYGRFISGLGDVNGDSINDLGIMGGEYFKIISGYDFYPVLTVYADTNKFGSYYNIAAANDINNDVYNDIFVGMQEAINNEAFNSIFVYYGGVTIDSIPDLEITQEANSFFQSAGFLGNINNDDYIDYILGAQDWYGGVTPGASRVNIYFFGLPDDVQEDINSIYLSNFILYQNYPNPFNSTTIIKYSIPKQEQVTLKIYDQLGRLVTTLVDVEKNVGQHQVEFHTDKLASGVYFYQLIAGNIILTNKLILLK